jgi:cell division septation protein DedD
MTSDVRALEAGDDGFHEIQLNGKQLVFLGMATTLVSVVIFLCGVLVGRGVKPLDTVAQAGGPQAFEASAPSVAPGTIAAAAPTPPPAAPPSTPAANGAAAAAGAADAAAGDTEPTPVGDDADADADAMPAPAPAPAAAAPAPAPPVVTPPAPARTAAAAPTPATPSKPDAREALKVVEKPAPAPAAAPTAPATGGAGKIAVQVGAFATRKEADTLAKRLSGRGYAVYVMNPTGDGKKVYRVRVGNYASTDEAQQVSAKLASQENLKSWITR